jgi:hypothetical protein
MFCYKLLPLLVKPLLASNHKTTIARRFTHLSQVGDHHHFFASLRKSRVVVSQGKCGIRAISGPNKIAPK